MKDIEGYFAPGTPLSDEVWTLIPSKLMQRLQMLYMVTVVFVHGNLAANMLEITPLPSEASALV